MTVRRGWCEVIVDYRPELSQQHGYFHGAVIGAIADNASGYGAFTTKSSEASDTALITVEYKINFIAPARGDALVAQGQIVHPGKTLTVCRANVLCLENGKEKLCATSVSTLISIKKE